MPSGRKYGQAWPDSFRVRSKLEAGFATPPDAGTAIRVSAWPASSRMTSSAPQDPSERPVASLSRTAGPPAAGTFFSLLSERTDRIETSFFATQLDSRPPAGRLYLPTASYEEMMEYLESQDSLSTLRTRLREAKTREFVRRHAKIVDNS